MINLVKNKIMKTSYSPQRPTVSIPFFVLGVLFCVCLIAANLLETKQILIGSFNLTAGLIVFPISYIINDCLVEVWGYSHARFVIWLGFFMNFLFIILGVIADWLPSAPYWQGEESFHLIFGLAPRIVFASFLAFLTGSFLNAYVMSRLKMKSKVNKGFSFRAIASTVVGETADSLIFFPLAFIGIVPLKILPLLMINQIVIKTLYEVMVLPITIRIVHGLKRMEGNEGNDSGVSYSPWKIFDI